MSVRPLVLRDQADVTDLVELAAELGFRLLGEDERTHWLLQSMWWEADDGTRIAYSEDHTACARFIEVEGPSADTIRSRLSAALPHYSEDEVLTEAESGEPVVVVGALGRLAILRPADPDPRYLEVWRRCLSHGERGVRRAAIRTGFGCAWPEFRDLVAQRLEREVRLKDALQDLAASLEEVD